MKAMTLHIDQPFFNLWNHANEEDRSLIFVKDCICFNSKFNLTDYLVQTSTVAATNLIGTRRLLTG